MSVVPIRPPLVDTMRELQDQCYVVMGVLVEDDGTLHLLTNECSVPDAKEALIAALDLLLGDTA